MDRLVDLPEGCLRPAPCARGWTNVETARDATHGFGLHGYNVNLSIDPGATERAAIVASRAGVYPYYCTEFCSALHMEFTGWLLVEPKGGTKN